MRYKEKQKSPDELILTPLIVLLELSISEIAYEPFKGFSIRNSAG